ncbi:Alpha/Beta hydrolase protein [Lasiosphaeria ovina]|uniref:Alpha/Beta hydrolase protein n=1 Tax=Lasiosphaeria ovina TaxID=92902 RepID=A0AAE0JUB3_9PEZI|nr:Alpha/Beta hydrolase protein [Lasiosphaeria ovina]
MLPEPTLTFTLPSLHDGLALNCRVYHPHSLSPSPHAPPWQKHVAIVAHPYAPLGGCYDDPVVDMVAATLLRLGFLVGTFNFRGAHGSAGRTSWTAKAEKADYMSMIGFMSYYVHFLDPFRQPPAEAPRVSEVQIRTTPASPTLSSPSVPSPSAATTPVLLLGGYSYGAMITSQLPPVEPILAPFETPKFGCPAAEIRLRAEHLADMQNTVLASARIAALDHLGERSPRKSLGLRIGGDEENRKSHDSRRSFSLDPEDKICKGVAELMAKAKMKRKQPGTPEDKVHEPALESLLPVAGRIKHQPAYLLISPLQGVITNLATMSFPVPFSGVSRRASTWGPGRSAKTNPPQDDAKRNTPVGVPLPDAEDKLVSNPTLAIYGDSDVFVAARKLRDWSFRLQHVPDSKFRAHEVSSAGHFWVQGNVAPIMRDAVKTFAGGVLHGEL